MHTCTSGLFQFANILFMLYVCVCVHVYKREEPQIRILGRRWGIGSGREKPNGIDTIADVLVIKLTSGFASVHRIILLHSIHMYCMEYLMYQIIQNLRENRIGLAVSRYSIPYSKVQCHALLRSSDNSIFSSESANLDHLQQF